MFTIKAKQEVKKFWSRLRPLEFCGGLVCKGDHKVRPRDVFLDHEILFDAFKRRTCRNRNYPLWIPSFSLLKLIEVGELIGHYSCPKKLLKRELEPKLFKICENFLSELERKGNLKWETRYRLKDDQEVLAVGARYDAIITRDVDLIELAEEVDSITSLDLKSTILTPECVVGFPSGRNGIFSAINCKYYCKKIRYV